MSVPGGDETPARSETPPVEPRSDTQTSPTRRTTRIASAVFYEGPLPDPDMLARYEQALPGAAERIFRFAEEEQRQRHRRENRDLEAAIRHGYLGTISGTLVAIVGFATSAFLGYQGHEWAASIVAAMDIAGIVGIIVTGRRAPKPDEETSLPAESGEE